MHTEVSDERPYARQRTCGVLDKSAKVECNYLSLRTADNTTYGGPWRHAW